MGLTSEQVGEAIHHEFENYWARYNIESLDNENHSSNWFQANLAFSSCLTVHLFLKSSSSIKSYIQIICDLVCDNGE